VALSRELADMLRKNRTIDWQKKESARAAMRRMVKKLLKNRLSAGGCGGCNHYGYRAMRDVGGYSGNSNIKYLQTV